MSNYIVAVQKDPNSDFGVSFPDFPGCITAGSTIDEAKDMAQNAIMSIQEWVDSVKGESPISVIDYSTRYMSTYVKSRNRRNTHEHRHP